MTLAEHKTRMATINAAIDFGYALLDTMKNKKIRVTSQDITIGNSIKIEIANKILGNIKDVSRMFVEYKFGKILLITDEYGREWLIAAYDTAEEFKAALTDFANAVKAGWDEYTFAK